MSLFPNLDLPDFKEPFVLAIFCHHSVLIKNLEKYINFVSKLYVFHNALVIWRHIHVMMMVWSTKGAKRKSSLLNKVKLIKKK